MYYCFFSHAFGMIPMKKGLFFEISFLHLFYDGKIAVCMFWVLSGYHIAKKMIRFSLKTYISFLIKKFIRLYPLYMISLFAGMLFCNMKLTFNELYFTSWFSGFWNRSVVASDLKRLLILCGDFNIINPPSWTMKYEFEMVILQPIILAVAFCVIKRQIWINLYLLILSLLVIVEGEKIRFLDITVFPIFCLGALILVNNSLVIRCVAKSQWVILVLSIFLMNIGNEVFFNEYNSITQYLSAIGCALCIIICLEGKLFDRVFRMPWLVHIGDISYEIYLLHFIVLLAMRGIMCEINNWLWNIVLGFLISYLMALIVHNIHQCLINNLPTKH